MPDAVIRLDADISQITVKFKKVGDATKEVGEKAAKSFDWTGGLNKTLEGIPKRLFTVAAAIAAVGEAAKLANSVAAQQAGYAASTNSRNYAAGQAATRMGGSIKDNMSFINSPSALTTAEDRLKFAESLASLQEERRAQGLPGLSGDKIKRLTGLYTSGGDYSFGSGGADLINAAKNAPYSPDLIIGRQLAGRLGQPYRGQGVDDLLGANLQNIPQETLVALRQRQLREFAVTQEQYYQGGRVESQREFARQTMLEQVGINHPYAGGVLKTAAGLPLVGGLVEFGQRHAVSDGTLQVLKVISSNIEHMRRQGGAVLPNLGARNEGPAHITP